MTVFSDPRARRPTFALSFVAVACLLGYGYYLQYVEYLDPCPLCITQRLFYMGIGAASLLGPFAVARAGWQRTVGALYALSALGGVATAGRQVWLQHLPADRVPDCGPGLQYWLDNESALSVLSLLFKGDGNCAEVVWTFLGFSIGEWSLAWFAGFLVVGLLLTIRTVRPREAGHGAAGGAGGAGIGGGALGRSA